jgi:hypothetical protein
VPTRLFSLIVYFVQVYASCAVVGNGASSLRDPRGGAAIDRHEAVFRFNFAQTAGYEGFVGSNRTIRIGNDVTSKRFLEVILESNLSPRAALSAQGWDGDEFIQWNTETFGRPKDASLVRRLCSAMHDPAFYVMRPTLVKDLRKIYREICHVLAPGCVPVSTPNLSASTYVRS